MKDSDFKQTAEHNSQKLPRTIIPGSTKPYFFQDDLEEELFYHSIFGHLQLLVGLFQSSEIYRWVKTQTTVRFTGEVEYRWEQTEATCSTAIYGWAPGEYKLNLQLAG